MQRMVTVNLRSIFVAKICEIETWGFCDESFYYIFILLLYLLQSPKFDYWFPFVTCSNLLSFFMIGIILYPLSIILSCVF